MEIIKSNKLFSKIIKYLEVNDFFYLCSINKKTYKNFNDSNIWKEKLEYLINCNLKDKQIDYKYQYQLAYNSKNRQICSICNDIIIKDFYITPHDCHYGFKKCVKINENDNYNSYHSNCLKKNKNTIICPLCKYPTSGYQIGYNI